MDKLKSWGDHTLYDSSVHTSSVVEYIRNLYTFELDEAHLNCRQYENAEDKGKCSEHDMEELHQKFYPAIKSDPTFLRLYENMCAAICQALFPGETFVVIQSMPNIRFHMPGTVAVPPHTDMDECEDGNRTAHPEFEHNFLLSITSAFDSNAMYLESTPGKGDFETVEMKPDTLLHFHGNKCVHGNYTNATGKTRVSIDFRAIEVRHMLAHKALNRLSLTRDNPFRPTIELKVGGYYKLLNVGDLILQMQPSFGKEEASAAYDYIMSGGFLTEHKYTRQLESKLAAFVGAKHCFMVSNGTLAISAALMAVGISKDDRVLLPTYTMIATANAIKLIGAVPVFADVDLSTNTLSVETIRSRIKDVDALIHVSLNNRCHNIREIVQLCKDAGKPVIEDAAQSLGSTWCSKALGTFGDVGIFSFSSPKIISMGQGGCLVTDDDEIAFRLRRIKDFGRDKAGVEEYSAFGLNFKFTDLQAVVGLEQLEKLPGRVRAMSEIWDTYYEHLSQYMIPKSDSGWIPWFIEIFIPNRDELAAKLRATGIGVREVYPPIHLQKCYNQISLHLPNAVKIHKTGLWLPSWSSLTKKQIVDICACIKLLI